MSEQVLSMNNNEHRDLMREELAEQLLKDFRTALEQSNLNYDTSVIKLKTISPPKSQSYEAINVEIHSLLDKKDEIKPLFRIRGQKHYFVSFPSSLRSIFLQHSVLFTDTTSDTEWPRLDENYYGCFRSSPRLAVDIFEAIMKRNEFGCCSRYNECSDAKRCVHPDVMFALKCVYRQNLIDGKVFYGNDRNL